MANLSFRLAGRLSGNSHGAVRAGSIIAILGVAFAVAVMEITMAVSFGFKDQITDKLQQFVPPLTITAPLKDNTTELSGFVTDNDELRADILAAAPDARIVPVVTLQGILKTENDFGAVLLKSYPDDYGVTFGGPMLQQGVWATDSLGADAVVLSASVARTLDISAGDRINFCYLAGERLKARPLTVAGIYESGLGEFDNLIAFANPRTLRKIYRNEPDQAVAIEVRGIPLDSVDVVADRLTNTFVTNAIEQQNPELAYRTERITQQGSLYLNWLSLLDTNVAVIFILMALVAACTLISALFIQVLEKVNTIGLLRALGARNKTIGNIFIFILLKYIIWGLIAGNIIGLGLIFAQKTWHLITLDPQMYYLSAVPVTVDAVTLALINAGVIIFCWLIIILPSRIATHLTPATTLRYD